MKKWIRYSDPNEFPSREYPHLTDNFLVLTDELNTHRPKKTIKKIIGFYPGIKKDKSSTIIFPVFSTSKTSYATIKELAPIFAKSFADSSITPIISPYPFKFYKEPDTLPRWTLNKFKEYGAMLYDIDL